MREGIVRAALIFLAIVTTGSGGQQMEQSIFWATDGNGDGVVGGYSQDAITEWQRMLVNQDPTTEGVGMGYLNELEVTAPGGLVLRVASGGGVVYGFPYRSTGNVDHTLFNPTLGVTGWRMVLRTDWATRTVRSVLLQSADGVAAIPALTQVAGNQWEISLAQGTVNNAGAVTITSDDRTPLGSGGRFTVQTADIAADAVTTDKIPNRTRKVFIPATGGYYTAAVEGQFIPHVSVNGWNLYESPGDRAVQGNGVIPSDFVSTAVLSPIVWTTTAGNYYVNHTVRYGAIGEPYDQHTDTLGAGALAMLANQLTRLGSVSMISASAGDFFSCWFYRDDTQGTDTGADLWLLGWELSYTADS